MVAEVGASSTLCSLNTAARDAGLTCGMALADARAILPNLGMAAQDTERDEAFLRALGRWAQRFTPSVAVEARFGSDGTLILDAGGCAHLFGGEIRMLCEIGDGLARFGLTTRMGLADTRGGAVALARFGEAGRIAPPGGTRQMIEPLPVAALGLETGRCADLMRLGLRTIRDLAALPRASVAKRFGVETVRLLDRALGVEADPLAPLAQTAPHAVRMSLPEPIGTTGAVAGILDALLARLCARLEREGLGARHLDLSIRRADGGSDRTGVGLMRPGRDARTIGDLFARKLDDLDAGFGIDSLRLHATRVEPLAAAQIAPGGDPQGSDPQGGGAKGEKLDTLLGRIANRVGFDAVIRLAPAESHMPERSWLRFSAAHSEAGSDGWPVPRAPRPVTILTPEALTMEVAATRRPPAHFVWRRQLFETVRATGPERITPEWWLDDPAWRTGLRDYWRIEAVRPATMRSATMQSASSSSTRQLWIYHTPEVPPESSALSRWYVHGVFA